MEIIMFAVLLNFLRPYLLKILGVSFVLLAAIYMYISWKHDIEHKAILEYNQKQMEQLVKDQALFRKNMDLVLENQKTLIENEKQFKIDIDKKLSSVNTFLSSDTAKKLDRPSSEILKRTIQELSSQ